MTTCKPRCVGDVVVYDSKPWTITATINRRKGQSCCLGHPHAEIWVPASELKDVHRHAAEREYESWFEEWEMK